MTRFVVCVDGTSEAMYAVRCLKSLLRESDSVTVVVVVERGTTRTAHRYTSREYAASAISRAFAELQRESIGLSSVVLRSPSSSKRDRALAIHSYCDSDEFDVIVVGRHSHMLATQLVIGSVSTHLVSWCRNAAVLVVPPKDFSLDIAVERTLAWCVDGGDLSLRSAGVLALLMKEQERFHTGGGIGPTYIGRCHRFFLFHLPDILALVTVNNYHALTADERQDFAARIQSDASAEYYRVGGCTTSRIMSTTTTNTSTHSGIVDCIASLTRPALVVVGHRHRTAMEDLISGSVTQSLLQSGLYPVLVTH